MTNKKISALTGATTPLGGTELVPIVQGGATDSVSVANLTAGRAVDVLSLTAAGTVINSYPTVGDASYYRMVNTDTGATSFAAYQMKTGFSSHIWQTFCRNDRWYIGVVGVADYIYVDSSANFNNIAGNYVPGTAAKGINFTANTPAAGMTSQLLNWYEEGTWTPVITSATGTITSYTSSGTYTKVGRAVTFCFDFNITNNGTGGAYVKMTLPFTSTAPGGTLAKEYAALGAGVTVNFTTGQPDAILTFTSNDGYPGGTGYKIRGSITYQG